MEAMLENLREFSNSDDNDVIVVEDDWIQAGRDEVRFSLVGKLLTQRGVCFEAFKKLFIAIERY